MEKKNQKANNGWENVGKMVQHIYDLEVETNIYEKSLYIYFVRNSFGYGCKITNPIPISQICSDLKLSNNTVGKTIKSLIEKELIVKVKSNSSLETGKKPTKYMVCYQEGLFIKPKDFNKKEPVGNDTTPIEPIECIKTADF